MLTYFMPFGLKENRLVTHALSFSKIGERIGKFFCPICQQVLFLAKTVKLPNFKNTGGNNL